MILAKVSSPNLVSKRFTSSKAVNFVSEARHDVGDNSCPSPSSRIALLLSMSKLFNVLEHLRDNTSKILEQTRLN